MIKLIRNERGSQTIEFVGVMPFFLLMIVIVWQFAVVAGAAITAKAAAMDGARVAMVDDSGQYETAVRNVAGAYSIEAIERKSVIENGEEYVTVKVKLQVPLWRQKVLFDLSKLNVPVSAEVTVRKEK